MGKYIVHLLLLFSSAICFSQDILVKRDSTKIEAKILEIRPAEIKYKYFNYQDGPTLILNKNEAAYVVYSNGSKEVFSLIPEQSKTEQPTSYLNGYSNEKNYKDSLRKTSRVGDYIKFNIQAGVVLNNSFSNLQRREPPASHTSSEGYSGKNDEKYNCNINVGFNFLFGKSPYIKHIIGVNYLRSTGEFDYTFASAGGSDGYGGYTNYAENFHYISRIDFINVVTGLRFRIFKKLYVEPLISINAIAQSDVRRTGTSTKRYISGGPIPTTYKVEEEYDSNKKVDAERSGINSTISLCPRASYEFKVKQQTLGVYVSYNIAYQFRLPWYMAGITYYPFKKLR